MRWFLLATATAAAPVAAEPFLSLPLDCTLGQTCFVEDYVDADPSNVQKDYTCGLKSRDGHRGVDFALLNFAAMEAGVDVLAAAAGVVDATRDGIADEPFGPHNAEALKGRECGNAVRILHDNGYQTLYCHLARGSIAVRSGDEVAAGAPLGQVGLSGQTNYPHVHISVLKDGKRVDPFAPTATDTCGETGDTLWLDDIPYTPTGLFTAGFSLGVPSFDDVRSGAARAKVAGPGDALVVYGHFFYAADGDVVTIGATGPEGEVFNTEIALTDPKISAFRAAGKRAPKAGWPKGAYRGWVELRRGETILAARHADIIVE